MSELVPIIKGKAYYIPMALRLMTDWLVTAIKSISGPIMERMNLPPGTTILTVSKTFGGLCKVHLAKFRGMNKNTFYLHIKECEFRYNYRYQNIYLYLLKQLRKNKLN